MNEYEDKLQEQQEDIPSVPVAQEKPKKTVHDWLRDLRMSASVNKTTVGVETDRVTPELLLATSNKLIDINKGKAEPDAKDSLEFQRIYGPTDFFAEHVLRDAGRTGRQLLWKATNKGNIDFMPTAALDSHVSDVFNASKLANMVDASSPMESIEASFKVSRIGEGGVASQDSAPTEMRLVQPSFLGFIDAVETPECGSKRHMVFTSVGWKPIYEVTTDDLVACMINGVLEYRHPEQVVSYDFDGELYCFKNKHIAYELTGNHRVWCKKPPHTEVRRNGKLRQKAYEPGYGFEYAENMHGISRIFQAGGHGELRHGILTTKILMSTEDYYCFDMVDWCRFLGWYLSEGCISHKDPYRRVVIITQNKRANPKYYEEINKLLKRLGLRYTASAKDFRIRSRAIYNEVEDFGYCKDKYIPDEVFEASREAQEAFIDALLKGDGRKYECGAKLCTTSKRLADDFERLLFNLGRAVSVKFEPDDREERYLGCWVVRPVKSQELWLRNNYDGGRSGKNSFYRLPYKDKVYCLTVPGGMFYTKIDGYHGFWTGNSFRVGLDDFMVKNVQKGSDGKLYQTFIDAHTGKPKLVDSVTAAKSVVTTPDMMESEGDYCYAVGGKTGVRIVKKSDVDYYLPHMDDAFTNAANLVPGMSGVKELRLRMGCLHPLTSMVVYDSSNNVSIVPAKEMVNMTSNVPGADDAGVDVNLEVRTVAARLPIARSWFRKIVLTSGRTLITSKDHRWYAGRRGKWSLITAEKLKPGDQVMRTLFSKMPGRKTFVNHLLVTRAMGLFFGYLVRGLSVYPDGSFFFTYEKKHADEMRKACERFTVAGIELNEEKLIVNILPGWLHDWIEQEVHVKESERTVPSCILSACLPVVTEFIDGFTSDDTRMAMDGLECYWVLDMHSMLLRDGIAFLLARLGTDTYFRDSYSGRGSYHLALQLVDTSENRGDCVLDTVKDVLLTDNAPVMIDVDVDDKLYATANGIITHNSKYPQQAVPVDHREAPLVRGTDSASGLDMNTRLGRFVGARFADRPATVTAVRKDRIDLLYDDGTKGSVSLYRNFPMNAKGFLNNTPQVKAGQHVGKGDLLASSNYTDDKGVAAFGTNLRVGWMSWKGGTYEDAIVLSESAANKLTSTTMYSTDLDLDKTVTLGKRNYMAWRPSQYTKEQLDNMDDSGVVKPGSVVRKGDPMVLAVRTSQPSPGTMGKRILTDLSQTWEHDRPGIVTDIMRTRNGVKVLATSTAPVEVGDKLANCYGGKGVVSRIYPDDEMPKDKDGKPLEMLMSPLGLITRTNFSMLAETLLGKVAHKTGKTEYLPAFMHGNMYDYVTDKLKQNHLHADDDFIDPETGRTIPKVVNGYSYIYKLKHMSESKLSARGTDQYSMDDAPAGSGMTGAKRFGMLEIGAMVGHGAFQNLLDIKQIRGQSNADFWRSVRTGGIPVIPGEPTVQKKFFAHLQGAGVNVRKTPKGISIFALSEDDVNKMAGPREVKSRDTYTAKTFQPIDGGLFGQDVFGLNGDKWGYIQLDEPVPNPVMASPLAKLLRMTDNEFTQVASGQATIDGMSNGADLYDRLSKINLKDAANQALEEFKNAPASKKDAALKRYVAVENMSRAGLPANQYMLDKIPVLPPAYRPITSHGGLTMVADANYLYAQIMDARDDFRDSANLPKEYRNDARRELYKAWQELTGMYDPEDVKLKNKNVQGLLKWALGSGSPKFSAFQRKVLGTSVDTVGRGAIVPSSKLNVDQIGIPVKMAMGMMAPFVERKLVEQGYSPISAMKLTKDNDKRALMALDEVVATHPVLMNRAPTLHKFNIMAFKPVLVQGNAIQVNPSICPGMNADFDGDSLLNLTRIEVSLEKLKEKIQKNGKNCLTSLEAGVYSAYEQSQNGSGKAGDMQMIGNNDRCLFATATGALSELPTVEGSELRKSDTVTEWDVQEGFYTDTVDPVTGKHALSRITKVSRHLGLTMFDCTLSTRGSFSHVVTASEDHSLITLNPQTLELEKTRPRDALNRMVPCVLRNQGNDWNICARYVHIDKDYTADYDLGMFIGLMLGDGWINCQNLAFIACCDESLQNYIVQLLDPARSPLPQKRVASLQQYRPAENRFSDQVRGRFALYFTREFNLALHKLIGDGAENKRIPEDSMMASRTHLIGILMGLLATDGTVCYSEGTKTKKSASKTVLLHTTSPLLRDGVQELCLRLGIHTTVTPYRGKHSIRTCYAIALSLQDLVREAKANPTKYKIPMNSKQEALDKIIFAVENSVTSNNKDIDIVPLPRAIACEILYANAHGEVLNMYNLGVASGYVSRGTAEKMLSVLDTVDWSKYVDPTKVPAKFRTHHSPEQAREMVARWGAIVRDKSIAWEHVDSVTPSSCTEGWDCTVPGPYTFTLHTGTVVQDTVNIHVPVSDNARKEALTRMLPSRNLLAPATHKIQNKPEKEFLQGIWIATRMGKAKNGRAVIFRTLEEAKEAERKGIIDMDTPIQILERTDSRDHKQQ